MFLIVLGALKNIYSIEVMTRLIQRLIHPLRNTINCCLVYVFVRVSVI